MGDKQSKEASPDDTVFYFLNEHYQASGCLDIEKFQQELISPQKYCYYQKMLEKTFEDKDIKNAKTQKQYKNLFRSAMPDKKRRELILQYFNLNAQTCETKYEVILNEAGEDFIEHTRQAKLASKTLHYHYLTDKGEHQLEIILALLFKERHIKHAPMMVSVASMLLIFMKPGEVYYVLGELITKSKEAFSDKDKQQMIRWHFTFEKTEYFKLLSSFVKSYLKTTYRGKRSVLRHLNKIGFDFNKFVDTSFKTMGGYFVPLPVAIDILMAYLCEGVKIIFRYTYAIMKCHKHFIKKCTSSEELLEKLQAEARINTTPQRIHKKAFKYPLNKCSYNYQKANIEKFLDPNNPTTIGQDFHDYVPNITVKSSIVSFDEFGKIWGMLPDYVKIRIPEIVYCSHQDGFNIGNLYRKMAQYKNEYKFSLILVQTKKDQIFGAYIDDVLRKQSKGYIGTNECFVFTLKPQVKAWYDLGVNQRYLYTELNYFQIGGEGDGPALRISEKLDKGQTNRSATFENDILTLGEKDKDDIFEIYNFEVYLL